MFEIARVQSVVMDITHPKYNGEDSVGTILYTLLDEDTPADIMDCLQAKPLYYFPKYIPIRDEIVYLTKTASDKYNEKSNLITYYMPPQSIQKLPTSNALPNALNSEKRPFEMEYFRASQGVRPLRPYEGDIILEGRFGNSIRFGSTIDNRYTTHPTFWSKEGNTGDPITIISNGQDIGRDSTETGFYHITENINGDDSSIYLCTNQQLSTFRPASLYDESYLHDIFKDTPQEEPNMDQTTTSLPDNLTEDPLLTEPNIIPPEDEQEMDELSDLQDTEIAYYDISPTETQTISPNDNISLPDNYTVPDTVTDVFLNEDIT